MENQDNLEQQVLPANNADVVESFKIEITQASQRKLELINKKLKFICDDIDPYNCEVIGPESENILKEFYLKESLENPFHFTNIMLRLMDLAETELKKRMH